MLKVTELIGKYVISLYDGQTNGEVENVLFDAENKKAKYLTIYDSNSNLTLVLPINKIYKIGDGAITIRNSAVLNQEVDVLKELEELHNPMNAKCFSVDGNLLGVVCDIELDNKLNIANILLNSNKSIPLSDIATFNQNTLLVYDGSKINIKNFNSKIKITKLPLKTENRYVNIMEITEPDEPETSPEGLANAEPVAIGPARAITNYKFLINRKVSRDIFSFNGEIIIKENSKINTSVIDLARCNGKLKELTMYSY